MNAHAPNVVVILSDDHGYGDFSHFGHDDRIRTPNLDRSAADAVNCTDAYVTAPICSPSRAGLISGQYQQRWGATWFDTSRFPPERLSLAERFRKLGYSTGYIGKVHYGCEQRAEGRGRPPNHGFDESFYGYQRGRMHYLRHSRSAVSEYGEDAAWKMAVGPMWDGAEEADYEGFITAELDRRACEFATASRNDPFFFMLAFNSVHNFCWQPPEPELVARGLPGYADWSTELSSVTTTSGTTSRSCPIFRTGVSTTWLNWSLWTSRSGTCWTHWTSAG